MTESIFTILSNKNFDEPREVTAVKAYIKRYFDADVPVAVKGKNIVVRAPNAAFAGTLRTHVYKIIKECQLNGRLIIRVG